MAVEAYPAKTGSYCTAELTTNAAVEPGDILQWWDGRACVVLGTDDAASGDTVTVALSGLWRVPLTDNIAILKGGRLFWDESANAAHFEWNATGDFALGVADEDVTAGTGNFVRVHLNAKQAPSWTLLDAAGIPNTLQEVNGLGVVVNPGGICTLEFDATSEQATASIMSGVSVPVTDKWIFEAVVNVAEDGDAGSSSTMDFVIGVCNDDHATDPDSITESCFVSLGGNTVNINTESDDGTTEVAATDSTKDYTLGAPFHIWMDARDNEDIQIYIDGVLVGGSLTHKLNAATGPLKCLALLEKSTDATTGKYEILDMRIRRVDTGGTS